MNTHRGENKNPRILRANSCFSTFANERLNEYRRAETRAQVIQFFSKPRGIRSPFINLYNFWFLLFKQIFVEKSFIQFIIVRQTVQFAQGFIALWQPLRF